jgi:hypothetical protein
MIPLPVITTGISLLGSLLSPDQNQDPYAEQRAMIRELMNKLDNREVGQAAGIKDRAAQTLGLLTNQIMDKSAAAGLPENLAIQQVSNASAGMRNNVDEALNSLKNSTFAERAQLAGMMPAKPVQENPWQKLGGIATQWMMGDKNSTAFLNDLWGNLGKGGGGFTTAQGFATANPNWAKGVLPGH